MQILVQLSLQFRTTRIQNSFALLFLFCCNILFGEILNMSILSAETQSLLSQISQLFGQFMGHAQAQNFLILSMLVVGTINLILFIALISLLKGYLKNLFIFILILNQMLSFFICRYLLHLACFCSYTPIKLLSILGVIQSIMYSAIYWLISSSRNPKNDNVLVGRKNKYILMKKVTTYAVIVATTVWSPKNGDASVLVPMFIQIVLSGFALKNLSTQFIFYNQEVQLIYLIRQSLVFCLNLTYILVFTPFQMLLFNNHQLFVFALTVFLIISIKQFRGFQCMQLIMKQNKYAISKQQALNYLYSLSLCVLDSRKNQGHFLMNTLKTKHNEQCESQACVCRLTFKSKQNSQQFQKILVLQQLNFIQNAFDKNLQIVNFCCCLKFSLYRIFTDTITEMGRFRKSFKFGLLQQIHYQSTKLQIKKFLQIKNNVQNATKIQQIQQQDKLIIFMTVKMQQQTVYKSNFWSILSKNTPETKALDKCISKQINLSKQINILTSEIYQSFRFSKTLLDFVSFYEIFILIKVSLSARLKEAYQNYGFIKIENIKMCNSKNFRLKSMMFQKNSVIFESKIEKNNMGIICNVSKNIGEVFGYNNRDVIGQNIKQIMPRTMQAQHDVILENWRQKCSWININKMRQIFAINRNHVCFLSSIYLRIVQREEAVNLLAAFIKINDQDYMLINEQGLIQGMGLTFEKVVGMKLIETSFSTICDQAQFILSDCLTNKQKREVCIKLYNVKGFEQQITKYQSSRRRLSQNGQQQKFPSEKQIKTRDRLVIVTINYELYTMGRLNFILMKLINIHKLIPQKKNQSSFRQQSSIDSKNTQLFGNQFQGSQDSQQEIRKQNQKEKGCQFNSSIGLSTHNLGMSSQKLFMNLEQKINNPANFTNRKIHFFCFFVILLNCLVIVGFIAQETVDSINNHDFSDHTNEVTNMFKKFNSISLAYSRLLNAEFGKLSKNVDNDYLKYQLDMALLQLKRTEQNILHIHLDLWTNGPWGQPTNLRHQIEWVGLNEEVSLVSFDYYFSFYLGYYSKLVKKLLHNLPEDTSIELQLITRNHWNLEKYNDFNIQTLKQQIIAGLRSGINISTADVGVNCFLIFFAMFFVYKLRKIKQSQSLLIMSIFYLISEKNCQQCGVYFKKMAILFKRLIQTANSQLEKVKFIQQQCTQNNYLLSPIQDVRLEKDKFEKRKQLPEGLYHLKKQIAVLSVIFLIFISSIFLKWQKQCSLYSVEINFIDSYYKMLDKEQQLVADYIQLKKIVFKRTALASEQIQFINSFRKFIDDKKSTNEQMNKNLYQYIQQAKVFNPHQLAQIQKFEYTKTCLQIEFQSQDIYNRICGNNTAFPYGKLDLFLVQSVIQQSINQVVGSLLKKEANVTENVNMIRIAEQAISIKYMTLCHFLQVLVQVIQDHHNDTVLIMVQLLIIYIGVFTVPLLSVFYLSRFQTKKMTESCGRVLIVPEIVLKATKGALKHIQAMLRALK